MYPNPTTRTVTLAIMGNSIGTKVMVTDISGRLMTSLTTDERSISFDMSNYVAGVYLFRINAGGKEYYEKVVVQ